MKPLNQFLADHTAFILGLFTVAVVIPLLVIIVFEMGGL